MSIAGRNDIRFAAGVAGLTFTLLASTAHAGGFERTSPGARANGRGGADVVGGDSPMSFMYNPANIIVGEGSTFRLEGALHLHFSEQCMERVEVIEADDGTRTEGETYPNVCGNAISAIPELGASFRVSNKLAFGFGVNVPPASSRSIALGDPDTVRVDPDGDAGNAPILTPSRYLLVEQDLIQLFGTFSAAYQPHDQFRLGVAFGWGITDVHYSSASFSHVDVINVIIADVTADAEALTTLEAVDAFVPRIQAGAWAQPFRDVGLELGASFSYTQNVSTNNGKLHLNTVDTVVQPEWVGAIIGSDGIHAEGTIEGVRLQVPQVSTLGFGLRYAQKLPEAVDDVGDRLSTERFDIELDVALTLSRRVQQFSVDLPDDAVLIVPDAPLVGDIEVALPDELQLEKHWRSQVAVRLGGDLSIVPGLLAVRAGASYESHGVERGYEQLDFQPFRQYGAHFGGTIRLWKKVDLSFAYAHIWVPDVTVGVDEAQVRRNVGGAADPNNPQDAIIANAGRYTGGSDILVLQAGASF